MLQHKRDFDGEGVAHAEMLFRSNILALVGGGDSPRFPPTKVFGLLVPALDLI